MKNKILNTFFVAGLLLGSSQGIAAKPEKEPAKKEKKLGFFDKRKAKQAEVKTKKIQNTPEFTKLQAENERLHEEVESLTSDVEILHESHKHVSNMVRECEAKTEAPVKKKSQKKVVEEEESNAPPPPPPPSNDVKKDKKSGTSSSASSQGGLLEQIHTGAKLKTSIPNKKISEKENEGGGFNTSMLESKLKNRRDAINPIDEEEDDQEWDD